MYTGYAISVQRVSCTDTKCVLLIALIGRPMGAHIVWAERLVSATPWQPVSQALQQSGTLPGIKVRRMMSLQGLAKWFGGKTPAVAAGSSAFVSAQTFANLQRYQSLWLPVSFSTIFCISLQLCPYKVTCLLTQKIAKVSFFTTACVFLHHSLCTVTTAGSCTPLSACSICPTMKHSKI